MHDLSFEVQGFRFMDATYTRYDNIFLAMILECPFRLPYLKWRAMYVYNDSNIVSET